MKQRVGILVDDANSDTASRNPPSCDEAGGTASDNETGSCLEVFLKIEVSGGSYHALRIMAKSWTYTSVVEETGSDPIFKFSTSSVLRSLIVRQKSGVLACRVNLSQSSYDISPSRCSRLPLRKAAKSPSFLLELITRRIPTVTKAAEARSCCCMLRAAFAQLLVQNIRFILET